MNTNPSTTITPLREMGQILEESSARSKVKKWWGALFWFGVCQDVYADIVTVMRRLYDLLVSMLAFFAKTSMRASEKDFESARIQHEARVELENLLKDGLDRGDEPRVLACVARLKQSEALTKESGEDDLAIHKRATRRIPELNELTLAEQVEAAQEKL